MPLEHCVIDRIDGFVLVKPTKEGVYDAKFFRMLTCYDREDFLRLKQLVLARVEDPYPAGKGYGTAFDVQIDQSKIHGGREGTIIEVQSKWGVIQATDGMEVWFNANQFSDRLKGHHQGNTVSYTLCYIPGSGLEAISVTKTD